MHHPFPLRHRIPRLASLGAIALAASLLAACGGPPMTGATGAGAASPRAATVQLLRPDGSVGGQAMLTAMSDGVEVNVSVTNLKSGMHGFHVHTEGSCAPGPDPTGKIVDFGAAGPHFDPDRAHNHGRPGDSASHAGELPNISVDGAGRGTLRYVNRHVTLAPGNASVIGRALVVHADPDDYRTDPSGNSGARVLCGVIEPQRVGSTLGAAQPQGLPAS